MIILFAGDVSPRDFQSFTDRLIAVCGADNVFGRYGDDGIGVGYALTNSDSVAYDIQFEPSSVEFSMILVTRRRLSSITCEWDGAYVPKADGPKRTIIWMASSITITSTSILSAAFNFVKKADGLNTKLVESPVAKGGVTSTLLFGDFRAIDMRADNDS